MDGEPGQGAVVDRAILGAADVSDDVLVSMIEDDLGISGVELVSCHAEVPSTISMPSPPPGATGSTARRDTPEVCPRTPSS